MSDTYRELRYVKFYADRVNVGREGYNPTITMSYNGSDELIKIKEAWRGEAWSQTVSGTNPSGPIDQVISYEVTYDPWEKV